MASGRHPDDEEEDAAALYLRRLQGGEQGAAPTASPTPPSPLRDARSGRLISGTGVPAGDAAPAGPSPLRPASGGAGTLPGAVPDAASLPPPALPRGVQKQFTAAHHGPGHVVAQPGGLPSWFLSDGLTALRNSQHREAGAFYQALVNSKPENPEGWMGLSAAMLGMGDLKKAADLMIKGLALGKDFPVGALAAEAKPGDPKTLYHFANTLLSHGTGPACMAAMLVLDECMASPMTPEPLYLKADLLRRKARETLEAWEARSNPAIMSMKRNAQKQRVWGSVVRIVFLLVVVVVGVLVFGYFKNRFQAEALVRLGTDEYIEAYRLANFGVTKRQSSAGTTDPQELLARAYDKFSEATQLNRWDFDAQYMRYKSLEFMASYGKRYQPRGGEPKTLQQVQAEMTAAQAVLGRMDPKKEKRTKKDQDLQGLMQRG